MMTMQKIYPRSNVVQASEKNEKSPTEIDRQLRDFVLQDTARLRSEAETAPKPVLRLEPEGVTEVIQEINSLVQQVAGITVDQVDDVIADFRDLRDFLHSEGERVRQEISGYLQLSRTAAGTTKIIVDNIAELKKVAVDATPPTGRILARTEKADVTASPVLEKPPAAQAGDAYSTVDANMTDGVM
jgi:hypothetical protein